MASAHTTWFFETFLPSASLSGYREFDPSFGYLFNSLLRALGPRHRGRSADCSPSASRQESGGLRSPWHVRRPFVVESLQRLANGCTQEQHQELPVVAAALVAAPVAEAAASTDRMRDLSKRSLVIRLRVAHCAG